MLIPAVIREGEHSRVKLSVQHWPEIVKENQYFFVPTIVTNHSSQMLSPLLPSPVRLSYHWYTQDGAHVAFDGIRTTVPFGLGPGETCRIDAEVQAPKTNGSYLLKITAVQEGCTWFEDKPGFQPEEKLIKVVSL